MMALVALIVMVTNISMASSIASPGRIRVGPSGSFVDEMGRMRTFHGVNAVEKLPPFHPQTTGFDATHTLSDRDADQLAAWGFNVVRLGVLWQAVMPEPGVVNATYLASIRMLVRTLATRGVYTLVDTHQDIVGSRFCGEGFPEWAVQKALRLSGINASDLTKRFPAPNKWNMKIDPATGWPASSACRQHNFQAYYLTTEVEAVLDTFFSSEDMWADFAACWKAIASALVGEAGILGFEIFNEPMSGYNPFVSDQTVLMPLYTALHKAIRQVDNDTIIFFEPHFARTAAGIPTDMTAGPGGAAYDDRQALAYHIYCFNNTQRVLNWVCDLSLSLGWHAVDNTQLSGGRMMTEFGAVTDDPISLAVLLVLLSQAEVRQQSWAYWNYKAYDDITTIGSPSGEGFYNSDGSLQVAKVAILSRPYASIVAGKLLVAKYDDASGVFTLRYSMVDGVTGASRIEKHEEFYFPRGYKVVITPAGVAEYSEVSVNAIEVRLISSTPLPAGTEIKITVSPLVEY